MCLSNFKAIRQFKVPISWLRDFTRSYEKMSFRILRRGPGRISSGWFKDAAVCHPDDLRFAWYHPDEIIDFKSSGWLSWNWCLIRMSYDNVIMSPSKWHTLPFLSHPDEIANFDFSQHDWPFSASVGTKVATRNDKSMVIYYYIGIERPCCECHVLRKTRMSSDLGMLKPKQLGHFFKCNLIFSHCSSKM